MVTKKSCLNFLIVASAFIAGQRFLLAPVNTILCIVPFIISIIQYKNVENRNTLLLVALFLCVDNASDELSLTPIAIRYPIYLMSIWSLYSNIQLDKRKLLVFSLVTLLFFARTLVNYKNIDVATFMRDIFLILFLIPSVCINYERFSFPISFETLVNTIIAFLISEILNILIRSNLGFDSTDYLSYISTKSLVVVPSFYFLVKGSLKQAFFLIMMTLIVLVFYSTRMIIVTYIISILLFSLKVGLLSIKKLIYSGVVILLFFVTIYFFDINLEGFKATGVFLQFFTQGDLTEKFMLIDPVRYNETKLFFERDLFSIMLGDGLGSGLIDRNNEFDFVRITDTAFSESELRNGVFYNLHDTWIDLGLRFGFLLILVSYYKIFRLIFQRGNVEANILGLILLVIYSCASYSTQGILVIIFIMNFSIHIFNKPFYLRSNN